MVYMDAYKEITHFSKYLDISCAFSAYLFVTLNSYYNAVCPEN